MSKKLPWTASSPCTYDALSEFEVNYPGVTRVKEDSSFVLFVGFQLGKFRVIEFPSKNCQTVHINKNLPDWMKFFYVADQKSHEAVEICAPVKAKITQR